MRPFSLSGEFKLGSQWKKFSTEISANDENHAKELLMAQFGSRHKLPRRFINVLSVSELKQSIVLQEPKSGRERTENQ